MESLLILAAVAATVIGCVLMAGQLRAGRRPPLLLPQEQDWADDEAGTIRKLTPESQNPIDRTAQVIDARGRETGKSNADLPKARALDARALDAELNRLIDRDQRAEAEQAGRRRQIG